ncbi:hypothetical protein DN310_19580 [Salmonella enterica subsp. salamae]|uniref:Uncharacterized protein n=1 Tax=Salmonella enterica subsp. salamae TaxID=59202 RepID=A0A5Y3MXZ3_SALER|nr:hypothetical protein [Salmonella enterica subsp. salamae]EEH5602440.1 hypothetical protein [Salmonella enterica subsp. enterica serovar Richmond]ELH0788530.1 hypothetical protein [Salmonella enterica]
MEAKKMEHLTVSVDTTTIENQMFELIQLFEQEKSFFECSVEEVFDLFRRRVSDLIGNIVVSYDPVASEAPGVTRPCFKVEFGDDFHRVVAAIRARDPDLLKV